MNCQKNRLDSENGSRLPNHPASRIMRRNIKEWVWERKQEGVNSRNVLHGKSFLFRSMLF